MSKSILDTTKWRYNPAWSLEDSGHQPIWNDKSLSTRAKGVYGYMTSKPANWDFSAKRIAEDSKDGVNTIARAMKELEDAGYLHKSRLATGRMHYTLSPEPYIGIEPKIERSSLEGLEIIMDTPVNEDKPIYPLDPREHLQLAYSAYEHTDDDLRQIIEENNLYSIADLNDWMQNNQPAFTEPKEAVNF